MKTGVQSVRKALKTLDSGFRRNDVEKNQIDFFTPSPSRGEGLPCGVSSGTPQGKGGGDVTFITFVLANRFFIGKMVQSSSWNGEVQNERWTQKLGLAWFLHSHRRH